MKVLFFGIYALGARALSVLVRRGIHVVGVVTKPDPGPAQEELRILTRKAGLPVVLPESPRDPGLAEWVGDLGPDLIAVAGYHKRLPGNLLALPARGCINTHLSLLPAYRGPCPWKWVLIRGERTTGVTVHVMGPRFDRGPILTQREYRIGEEETGGTLFEHLSQLGAELLGDTLLDLQAGRASSRVQDEGASSYQGPPSDADARICWSRKTRELLDLIRGLSPRPGAWTTYGGRRLLIRQASIGRSLRAPSRPGSILDSGGGDLSVATGDGILILREIADDDIEKNPGESLRAGTAFDEAAIPEEQPIRR